MSYTHACCTVCYLLILININNRKEDVNPPLYLSIYPSLASNVSSLDSRASNLTVVPIDVPVVGTVG